MELAQFNNDDQMIKLDTILLTSGLNQFTIENSEEMEYVKLDPKYYWIDLDWDDNIKG